MMRVYILEHYPTLRLARPGGRLATPWHASVGMGLVPDRLIQAKGRFRIFGKLEKEVMCSDMAE